MTHFSKYPNNLGNYLKAIRKEKNIPLRKVAAYLDLDPSTLSKIENGKRQLKKEDLHKVSRYYKIENTKLLELHNLDNLILFANKQNLKVKSLKRSIEIIENGLMK